MASAEQTEHFVSQLTANQNRLFGYVYSLLGDQNRAADVVQETNLVLWRKLDEFQSEKPFLPWALTIARFQVMAHLRDQSRDRLLLDAELADALSVQTEKVAGRLDEVRGAMQNCLQTLSTKNQELIRQRYFDQQPIADVASATDRTVSAVKVALMRIRRQLSECVDRQLAAEADV